MSLHDKEAIDIIFQNPQTGTVDLVLYDDGAITDELQRYNLVIDKAMAYLNYVASGQLIEQHPENTGMPVRCCVVCRRHPNEAMLRLEGVKDRDDANIRLDVVVFSESDYLPKSPTGCPSGRDCKQHWWRFW